MFLRVARLPKAAHMISTSFKGLHRILLLAIFFALWGIYSVAEIHTGSIALYAGGETKREIPLLGAYIIAASGLAMLTIALHEAHNRYCLLCDTHMGTPQERTAYYSTLLCYVLLFVLPLFVFVL